MTMGPGKYDHLATYVREATNAMAVVVIVLEGREGSGFSVQALDSIKPDWLPSLLRDMADGIERDIS